jgi:hypothetical protein
MVNLHDKDRDEVTHGARWGVHPLRRAEPPALQQGRRRLRADSEPVIRTALKTCGYLAASAVAATALGGCGQNGGDERAATPHRTTHRSSRPTVRGRLSVGGYRVLAGPVVYSHGHENSYEVWAKMNHSLPRGSVMALEGYVGDGIWPAEDVPPSGRQAPRCYHVGLDNTLNSAPSLTRRNAAGRPVRVTIRIPHHRRLIWAAVTTSEYPPVVINFKGYEDTQINKLRALHCAGARAWERKERVWQACDRKATTRPEHQACEDTAFGIKPRKRR